MNQNSIGFVDSGNDWKKSESFRRPLIRFIGPPTTVAFSLALSNTRTPCMFYGSDTPAHLFCFAHHHIGIKKSEVFSR